MIELLLSLLQLEREAKLQDAIDKSLRQFEAKRTKRFKVQRPQIRHTTPQREDEKIFGVNVRVDEPRAQDYTSHRKFIEDHQKFDDLVEAAERCTWQNKSNTAPLHKVNAFRRRLEDGPVIGKDLIGETDWWW